MKSLKIIASAILLSLGLSLVATAKPPKPKLKTVNNRQHDQKQRIGQGVKSGEVKPWELKGLAKEQRQIANLENRIKSDGVITMKERAKLQKELNQASRHIYRAKHN